MENNTTTAPTLVGYSDAAARWQVSERTIARLAATGEIKTYNKLRDKRRKLVSIEEVAEALGPAPTTTEATETTTVALAEVATTLLVAAVLDERAYRKVRESLGAEVLNKLSALLGGTDELLKLDERAGYPTEKR